MENTNPITLKEALKIFQKKDSKGFIPFDITYRTFNSQTKQGGKLVTYQGVKYLPQAKKEDADFRATFRTVKPPNHYENRTRNIELANGDIKTVRIDFMISINSQNIIY